MEHDAHVKQSVFETGLPVAASDDGKLIIYRLDACSVCPIFGHEKFRKGLEILRLNYLKR